MEANFVEPAHDKQGFERTLVLSRLEQRLIQMQKNYWGANCHQIGYCSNRSIKLNSSSAGKETSPDPVPESQRKSTATNGKATSLAPDEIHSKQKRIRTESKRYSEYITSEQSSSADDDDSDQNDIVSSSNQAKGDSRKISSVEGVVTTQVRGLYLNVLIPHPFRYTNILKQISVHHVKRFEF